MHVRVLAHVHQSDILRRDVHVSHSRLVEGGVQHPLLFGCQVSLRFFLQYAKQIDLKFCHIEIDAGAPPATDRSPI